MSRPPERSRVLAIRLVSDYSLTVSGTSGSSARSAILREARRLFAEKGYAATSVAEIQAAAGLAPGSGALYKHFPSKQALLDAVLEVSVPAIGDDAVLPTDPAQALPAFATALLTRLSAATDLLRIQLRDLEAAPELLTAAERTLSAWLSAAVLDGRVRDHDCDAVAHLLSAALLHGAVLEALAPTRKAPDRDRVLAAWLDLALTALDPRRDLLDDLAPPAY